MRLAALRFRAFLLAFAALLPTNPAFAADNGWTGTWDTHWRDGGAWLELRQDGDKVEGKYAALNGTVDGTIVGRVFKGHWHQGPRSGSFDFVLAHDGGSLVGRYGTGEWWTGARLASDPDAGAIVDLSTPRAAMRTFLDGGNAAATTPLTRWCAPPPQSTSATPASCPRNGSGRTKALFDAVDATTFRLFLIPDAPAGDTADVTLQQAGNGVELPLLFKKDR